MQIRQRNLHILFVLVHLIYGHRLNVFDFNAAELHNEAGAAASVSGNNRRVKGECKFHIPRLLSVGSATRAELFSGQAAGAESEEGEQ